MKITIVQPEIEEAVRAYIHSQIQVKEGHSITMKFSATRGEDGLIADIDISPSVAPSGSAPAKQVTDQESSVAPAPRVTRQRVAKDELAATTSTTPAPATETAPVEQTEDAPSDEAGVAPARSIFGSSTIADPEPDSVDDVEGSQPLKRSIFAGLERPTNGTAEAAA